MSTQQPANLAEMVRERARSRGNALAYEFEGRHTSFAEFDIKTNRVANALIALGVKPRERIAYLGKNSDIYFELLLGAMKANVVMAPVNWRLAGPRWLSSLATARRRCCLSDRNSSPRPEISSRNCPTCVMSSPPKAARRSGRILRRGGTLQARTIRR